MIRNINEMVVETDGNETNLTNSLILLFGSFFFLATEEEEDEVDYVPDYNEYSIYILPSDRLEIDEVGPRYEY